MTLENIKVIFLEVLIMQEEMHCFRYFITPALQLKNRAGIKLFYKLLRYSQNKEKEKYYKIILYNGKPNKVKCES